MTSDLLTKNLGGALFEKHASEFAGEDECHQESKRKQLNQSTKNNKTSLPAIKDRFDAECSRVWNEVIGD